MPPNREGTSLGSQWIVCRVPWSVHQEAEGAGSPGAVSLTDWHPRTWAGSQGEGAAGRWALNTDHGLFYAGGEAGALGSEGGGPELVLELWPWAHPSPACSLLSALGKTTRLPALLDERRRVKPSDGAQHTRKCRKVGGSPSQRRAEPQTSRGQHAAAGGGCWTGHPPCGESEA